MCTSVKIFNVFRRANKLNLISLCFLLSVFSVKARVGGGSLSEISDHSKIQSDNIDHSDTKNHALQIEGVYISNGTIVKNADLIYSNSSKKTSINTKKILKKNNKYIAKSHKKRKPVKTLNKKIDVLVSFRPFGTGDNYFCNPFFKEDYANANNNYFKKIIRLVEYKQELFILFYIKVNAYSLTTLFSQNKYFLNKNCIRPPTRILFSLS